MKTTLSISTLSFAIGALVLAGTASAAEQSAQSEVTGEIVGTCVIAAENTDFGQVPVSQAGMSIDRTVNLTVNCSNQVNYKLSVANEADFSFTPSAGSVGSPFTGTLTFSANNLSLANEGAPIGDLSYWQDTAKSTPFDVGTSTSPRTGTGADEIIPVTVSWTLPPAADIQGGSFGLFSLTNTYKVEF